MTYHLQIVKKRVDSLAPHHEERPISGRTRVCSRAGNEWRPLQGGLCVPWITWRHFRAGIAYLAANVAKNFSGGP